MANRHGIFCLESEWEPDLRIRYTIEPLLQLLQNTESKRTPYIHRDVPTVNSMEFYLGRWSTSRYWGYPILYLACHGGRPGWLRLADGRNQGISFEQIGKLLEGMCKKCVIYFGSCASFARSSQIDELKERTRAAGVMGYMKAVGWADSCACDFLALNYLANTENITPGSVKAIGKKVEADLGPGLRRRLRFSYR